MANNNKNKTEKKTRSAFVIHWNWSEKKIGLGNGIDVDFLYVHTTTDMVQKFICFVVSVLVFGCWYAYVVSMEAQSNTSKSKYLLIHLCGNDYVVHASLDNGVEWTKNLYAFRSIHIVCKWLCTTLSFCLYIHTHTLVTYAHTHTHNYTSTNTLTRTYHFQRKNPISIDDFLSISISMYGLLWKLKFTYVKV